MRAKYTWSNHGRPQQTGFGLCNVWQFFRDGVAVGRIIETEHGYRGIFNAPRFSPVRELRFFSDVVDRMVEKAERMTWN